MNNQENFSTLDWESVPNSKKQLIIQDFNVYVLAVQNFTQFNVMHRTDLKCLLTFLLISAFGFFFNLKLESVITSWVVLQIFMSVISKLAQIGSAIELKRSKDKLSESLNCLNGEGDSTSV
jgi:hypothetical protein